MRVLDAQASHRRQTGPYELQNILQHLKNFRKPKFSFVDLESPHWKIRYSMGCVTWGTSH
jgi:hypothetical protein